MNSGYRCLGCGNSYGHKTGLLNHRHVCIKWKNLDGIAKHKKIKLELDKQKALALAGTTESGPGRTSLDSETPGPAQPDDLLTEVRNLLRYTNITDRYRLIMII